MGLDDVDALIADRIDTGGPGVAVAIVHNGEVVYERGYGLASLEWNIPLAPDTVLGLGSLTKPFTAQGVMLLKLAGKLRVEDPAATYLPDLPWLDPHITIAHLLTHTSGLANFVTQPSFWERVSLRNYTLAEHIEHIGTFPADFAPGERYSYSNSGYALLGLLIERVSSMPYDEYLRAAIFEPLGMSDTRFLWDEPIVPRQAGRYELAEPGGRAVAYERAIHLGAIFTYGNGGLASTTRDLIRWDAALREHTLLPAEVEARIRQPVTLNDGRSMGYGLGWGLSGYREHAVVHHAGGVPGYSAFLGRFVEDGLTIIALSNLGGFDAAGLAADIANSALELPTPNRTPIEATPEQLAAAEGIYTNIIGERLEVVLTDGQLELRGTRHGPLLALGDGFFELAGKPDVTVRFEAPNASRQYTGALVVTPFYWYEVLRDTDESEP